MNGQYCDEPDVQPTPADWREYAAWLELLSTNDVLRVMDAAAPEARYDGDDPRLHEYKPGGSHDHGICF